MNLGNIVNIWKADTEVKSRIQFVNPLTGRLGTTSVSLLQITVIYAITLSASISYIS